MKPLLFAYPFAFLLIGFLPLLFYLNRRLQIKNALGFSQVQRIKSHLSISRLNILQHLNWIVRLGCLLFLVFALARPQYGDTLQKRSTEGLDIVLAIDCSGSMNALDFVLQGKRRTRNDVAKAVISEFIDKRKNDRIGLVVFGSKAYTVAPITYDHDVLKYFLEHVEVGVAGTNTAIGDGIATAVKRMKDLKSKSRVLILLTDGENNAGTIAPEVSLEIAKTFKVKIYTIAMGRDGYAPILNELGQLQQAYVSVDEELLKHLAQESGGQFYSADNTETLQRVYQTIDSLEKTKEEVSTYRRYEEKYHPFVFAALIGLIFEIVFMATKFRRLP